MQRKLSHLKLAYFWQSFSKIYFQIIEMRIGKKSFGAEKLKENFHALMEALIKAKPAAAKGQYVKSVTVSSTMGPGAKINPVKVLE